MSSAPRARVAQRARRTAAAGSRRSRRRRARRRGAGSPAHSAAAPAAGSSRRATASSSASADAEARARAPTARRRRARPPRRWRARSRGSAPRRSGSTSSANSSSTHADPEPGLHVARRASPATVPATSGRESIACGTLTRSSATSVPQSDEQQRSTCGASSIMRASGAAPARDVGQVLRGDLGAVGLERDAGRAAPRRSDRRYGSRSRRPGRWWIPPRLIRCTTAGFGAGGARPWSRRRR